MKTTTTEQPAAKQSFAFAYAYDTSAYADFLIEAASQEEAERIAAKLLEDGTLATYLDALAMEYDNPAENHRVFPIEGGIEDGLYTLPELAAEHGPKLADGWDALPPEEVKQPEQHDQTAPHTPGPWTKWEGRTVRVNGYDADIIGSECAPVCYVQQGTESPATLANSRLIQIAPDLLAFAEMVRLGNTEFDQLEEMAAALVYRARHGRRPQTADQD